jgi:hypothetical protein
VSLGLRAGSVGFAWQIRKLPQANALLVYWSSGIANYADLEFFFLLAVGLGFPDNVLVKILSLRAFGHQLPSEIPSLLDNGAKHGTGLVKQDPEETSVAGRLLMAFPYSSFLGCEVFANARVRRKV